MTYEEKHYSEIYSVLRMLGEEYIKKIPNSLYSYIISNKSNEYNPVFVKDKPLEEQIINQDILDEINCFKYCYWSNESEQDKELQTFMDLLNDYGKWLIWSHTLPKVQSKHIDTLLELLKIPELTKKVWKDTDDNVKDAFFVQIIQEIKDEECILQISNATSIEMIQRHLEVVPIILKVQINTEKRVGYNYYLRKMLKEIVKNKDEITKLMNKNRELMIEIFAYLDSDTQNNIVKDIIRECEDGNVAIKIWRNCNSKVQQNNFDEINYMLEKFLDLAKDIIEVTSTDVIIENFDDMIQNEKIALYVWGKTNFKEEFQREKAIYLKQLFERYPDKINLILLGTNGNVQYENRDFIIKQIKDPKNKENLFSNYYHLNSKIKEENLDLFFLILENNPEKICNIWVSSISGEMIENLLTEDFLDRYQTILEKTIYDSKSPWKMWIIQPIEVRNKCKNIFINLIKKYPNEFLRYKQYLAWQDIDLLFEIMEIHKDEAIELWKCIPKKERKNYIDRMIELNKENVQIVEEVWRKSTEEELNEGSLEKIFKILCPNVEDVNKVIENYKKIEKINANIKDKINLKILDPKILKDYSIFIIAQIANYEDIQEKFLQGVKISIRNKIMRDACKNNNDMIMTLNLLLENFEKNKDIIDTINNQDLKSDEINSIMNFLINRDTNKIREFFDIKTSQDVINFNDIKKKKCIEIIERKEYEQEDSYESVRDKREAVLQLFFGISVEDAYFLNERYGNSINNNQSEIGIQEYMNLIKQFLDSEKAKENSINFFTKHKEELLKGSYIWQNMNICKVQAELNKKFSEIYQESIYKIKEEDLLDEKEYYIDKDGNKKEILVYEIKDDFNIFVRSEGAYNTNWEEPENFLDKINTPKIDYHGNCESFIGQDSIAVARTKGVIYGYLNAKGMLLQAPYDLGSNYANTRFDAINGETSLPAKFMLPQEMIDSTRHGHNEFTFERLNYDEKKGELQKRMPECVIWIEEGEDKENNDSWRMTKKAAAQLGLPILVINRERFLISENKKIQKMLENFLNPKKSNEETINVSQSLHEIITKFQNNYIGNRYSKESLKTTYFTLEQLEDILNKIEAKIETIKREDSSQYYECIKTMKTVAISEIKKYSNGNDEPEFDWQSIMVKYEEKIEEYEKAMKSANLNRSYKDKKINLSSFNQVSTSIKLENRNKEKSGEEINAS